MSPSPIPVYVVGDPGQAYWSGFSDPLALLVFTLVVAAALVVFTLGAQLGAIALRR